MQVKYSDVCRSNKALELAKNGPVHLLQWKLGSDQCVLYEILPETPLMPVNKAKCWTEPGGFATAATYLGRVELEIIDIPAWVDQD